MLSLCIFVAALLKGFALDSRERLHHTRNKGDLFSSMQMQTQMYYKKKTYFTQISFFPSHSLKKKKRDQLLCLQRLLHSSKGLTFHIAVKWSTLLEEKLYKIHLENEGRGLNLFPAKRYSFLWSQRNQCCWIFLREINTNNQSLPEDNLIKPELTPTGVRQDIFPPMCQYQSLSPYLLLLSQVIFWGQRLSWGFN